MDGYKRKRKEKENFVIHNSFYRKKKSISFLRNLKEIIKKINYQIKKTFLFRFQ
jgi:hypothetical protein